MAESSRLGAAGFRRFQRDFADATRCTTCGKQTAILNVAHRGRREEAISPDVRCTCPGGPAASLVAEGQQP